MLTTEIAELLEEVPGTFEVFHSNYLIAECDKEGLTNVSAVLPKSIVDLELQLGGTHILTVSELISMISVTKEAQVSFSGNSHLQTCQNLTACFDQGLIVFS